MKGAKINNGNSPQVRWYTCHGPYRAFSYRETNKWPLQKPASPQRSYTPSRFCISALIMFSTKTFPICSRKVCRYSFTIGTVIIPNIVSKSCRSDFELSLKIHLHRTCDCALGSTVNTFPNKTSVGFHFWSSDHCFDFLKVNITFFPISSSHLDFHEKLYKFCKSC